MKREDRIDRDKQYPFTKSLMQRSSELIGFNYNFFAALSKLPFVKLSSILSSLTSKNRSTKEKGNLKDPIKETDEQPSEREKIAESGSDSKILEIL